MSKYQVETANGFWLGAVLAHHPDDALARICIEYGFPTIDAMRRAGYEAVAIPAERPC